MPASQTSGPFGTLEAEPARARRALGQFLGVVAILLTVPMAEAWFARDHQTMAMLLCGEVIVGGCAVFTRLGRWRLAAAMLACSLVVMATALMVVSGLGSHDVSVLMIPGALVVGGLLVEWRMVTLLTALACLALAGLYLAELHGILVTPYRDRIGHRGLVDALTILLGTGIGVGLMSRSVAEAMRAERGAARALAEANRELQARADQLRASEVRLTTIFRQIPMATAIVSLAERRLLDVNCAFSDLTGRPTERLVGRTLQESGLEALLPNPAPPIDAAPQACGPRRFQCTVSGRDGQHSLLVSLADIEMDGQSCVLLAANDITDRVRSEDVSAKLQSELRQSQKMEAVGRLAGGVAHDFNNLLTAITNAQALAIDPALPEADRRELLTEAQQTVARGAELTRQLLAFSRKQVIAPVILQVDDAVSQALRLLSRLLGEDLTLQPRLAAPDGRVRVDAAQLEQILVNIALNSRDAMPGGGVLTVETAVVHVGAETAPEGATPGEYIKLSVTDTGTGMSPEVRQHMFEPFFTTKPPGQGTGLGMSMVFGAVRQNGGFITVDSALGQGTTISIFLPRVWDAADTLTPTPVPTPPTAGSARLLFVEDEDVTRRIIVRGLERAGYSVVGCACPEEALRAVRSQTFDLMITDLVMPGMNGQQLAQMLRKDHPHLQVLYTSGYPEELIAHHGVLERGLSYLPKPYTFEQLQTKISASLARGRRDTRDLP